MESVRKCVREEQRDFYLLQLRGDKRTRSFAIEKIAKLIAKRCAAKKNKTAYSLRPGIIKYNARRRDAPSRVRLRPDRIASRTGFKNKMHIDVPGNAARRGGVSHAQRGSDGDDEGAYPAALEVRLGRLTVVVRQMFPRASVSSSILRLCGSHVYRV